MACDGSKNPVNPQKKFMKLLYYFLLIFFSLLVPFFLCCVTGRAPLYSCPFHRRSHGRDDRSGKAVSHAGTGRASLQPFHGFCWLVSLSVPYGPRFGSPWLTSREKESSTWAKRERRRTPAGLAEEWDEKGWRLERGNRLISLSLGLESLSLLSTHSNSDRRERGPFHDERKVIGRDPAVTRISEIKSYIYYPYPRCFRSLFVPVVSHFTHHSLREAARRDKDNKFKVLHGCSWRTWCSEWRTRRKEGTEGTIRMTSGRTCMNDMISFL